MDIDISGTVVATGSCSFNQGGSVGVDFGSVKYSTFSGNTLQGEYTQPLPSSLNCTGDTDGNVQMKLDSAGGSYHVWNEHTILPVLTGKGSESISLGIGLQVNGAEVDCGKWFSIDLDAPPDLMVSLIQYGDGSDFVDGDTFTASGTLTVAFN
ncbi:type 1 fimbrial protein [Enterobacter mori]|uniref:Type 1 fimbrial protein n=1 Tax=Enterobacter mori TaxID=539813 RepID=A0A7T0GZE7_9ENTR|nr:fimbrial protein [Enterobacter mori]QPJ99572.1 type 1 fimbrial protein [Enterobacter mori]